MEIYGLTDVGAVRRDNQDSYAIRTMTEDIAVAVVCDGMGGARAGNVASAIAVETFCAEMEAAWKDGIPKDVQTRQEILADACRRANERVFEQSLSSLEYEGMGTTLVAAMILPEDIYIINVGDSRCYLIDDTSIQQVTMDHSLVQVLVERGEITVEQARTHPKKNLITRALGVDEYVLSDLYRIERKQNCKLLLCSDGLSNVIPDDILYQEISGNHDPEECARKLLSITMEQGAPDNVTVVLAQL